MTGTSIAERLAEVVNLEEMPEWPPEEVVKQITKGPMNSRLDERSPRWLEHNQPKNGTPTAGTIPTTVRKGSE
jgi:hypothetical protein